MLDEEWIDLFNSHHTSIAVSLDGLKPFHDAQRVYANGKGSFDDVIAAIRLLNATNTRFRALMVVNPDQDPREFYQFLSKEAIREIDLLLPMYNHSYRMPEDFDLRCADFMTGVFDHWFAENDSSRKIRIFESMLAAMLHRKPASCTLMNCACRTIITVQSDMNVGLCEDLSYTPVFNLSPLRADETDFIEIEQKVNQIISGGGLNVLPGQCETCDYQNVCNGGCPGLRFKAEGGFTNPSVYCRTYQKLIKRMYDTIGEKTLARYREMKG